MSLAEILHTVVKRMQVKWNNAKLHGISQQKHKIAIVIGNMEAHYVTG